ncbi:hypothetical protein KIH39_14760 [Telmatocola sphagniphila]|uniref:Uncharacterized protein n=1 Tax=Telmatocola sphagniphila TaxID=1123043 RepID=A0A8E6EWG5_9BACT|nr:hypothetical protein [Telmatocola sphagniphila]QVL30116.1 hypothetical protein KIH39_14760 [Telmatocola sphagniphila]
MLRRSLHLLWAGFVVFGLAQSAQAGPPLSELMNYFPETTNAILRIQVADIIKSPRGVREKWGQKESLEYLAGTIPIHPSIERVIIGSQFDPHNNVSELSISLIPTTKEVSLDRLAAKLHGTVEEIGGEKMAVGPQSGYYVSLHPELLANVASKQRQVVSKWLKFARANTKSVVTPYLQNAVVYSGSAHIMMAVETDDMINPMGLRRALEASKIYAEDLKTMEVAQRFLSALKGVRIAVTFGETTRATIYLDSRINATNNLTSLKNFLLYIMDQNGTTLEDMPGAKVRVENNSVIFDLGFSDSDLMKMTSILGTPIVSPSLANITTLEVMPSGPDGRASHRYYRTINQYIAELKRNTQLNPKPPEAAKHAQWYEVYTRKMSQVSVLNVDPEVLAFGQATERKFMAIAESLRGTPIELDKLQSQKYYFNYGGSIFWGNGYISSNIPEIEAKQWALIQKDEENRKQAWKMIDYDKKSLRDRMLVKYKVDFDEPLK